MRKIRIEEFKKMYLSAAPVQDIADYFGVKKRTVYNTAYKLGLKRVTRVVTSKKYPFILKMQRAIEFLKNNGWFCRLSEFKEKFGPCVLAQLLYSRRIFKVYCGLKRKHRFFKGQIFKPEFNRRYFVCLGRTGMVRLFMAAIKYPKNQIETKLVTEFLRSHLTEAEISAVFFHLAAPINWAKTLRKKTIQVDGIYKPRCVSQ